MLKEFKEFAMRGNVVDMAVGIIIGAAFGTIVKSLVADVLMPPIGMLLGGVDFANIFVVLKGGTVAGPGGISASFVDAVHSSGISGEAGIVDGGDPEPNSAPTISGVPATTVTVGSMYSFTPNANDADNDALTFSIQNKPGWAAFDNASGRLSGQPSLGDEGAYNNIQITVSDGKDSSAGLFLKTGHPSPEVFRIEALGCGKW